MPKLDEQIKTLAGYFVADCEPDGKLTLQLEVEHFLTRSDGQPPAFADVQAALRDLQQQTDAPIITDGEYFGYSGPALTATLGPACQLRISLAPLRDVQDIMDLYNRFYLQLGLALAAHGLRAWTAGCHPTCHAEDLPLVPRTRDKAMDAYLREKGACSVQMMRATAATQVSIDYQDETDFVRKMRAASLLTPFFALLSDNAPVYQASRNSSYCIRTRLWQDVDRDRCGVTPHLMDADFGYVRYAENVLTKPQITALRLGRVRAAGGKIAPELYAGHVSRQETAQILSNFFYDVRLKSRIELRAADSMPPRYIAAYVQLVKSVFGSPAALQNVLRHYAGATTLDITSAKLAVCKDGYNALVYGRPVSGELAWLLMQARSRTPSQEERALLDPFMQLLTTRKTIRETENYNE